MCRTIGEFVELILQTEITEAEGWLDAFVENYNDSRCEGPKARWEDYCKQALTSESVQNMAYIFSAQISFEMKDKPEESARLLLFRGHHLLQEIYRKAVDLGLEVKEKEIDWILEPGRAIKKSA